MIKVKNAKETSKFDINLLDGVLAMMMDLEMTPKTRFLCCLVLSGHEFANSEQIETFFPKFLKQMSHDQMRIEAFEATHTDHEKIEDFITKIIDIKAITDFLPQFLMPTSLMVNNTLCILPLKFF